MELFLLETTVHTAPSVPVDAIAQSFAPLYPFLFVVFIISCAVALLKNPRFWKSIGEFFEMIIKLLVTLVKEIASLIKNKRSNSNHSVSAENPSQPKPTFLTTVNDGRNPGEKQLEAKLFACYKRGFKGYFLYNLYVPKSDGTTTEVDAVYITAKGIFVFESKDYSGWIFGSDTQKQWMQTFKNGKKQPFPNPVWQNDTHIKCLGEFLKWKIPFFSFVVFSDNCEIKKMSVVKSQAKVIQQYQLVQAVINTFNAAPDIFNDEQMKTLLRTLKPLTQKTAAEKDVHVANVQNRHNANENTRAAQPIYVASAPVPAPQPAQTEQSPVCPLCGKALQERVAQNGDHAGQTYEVCTDYPNCTYAKITE